MRLPKHISLHQFENSEILAEAFAREIAHQLGRSIQIRGHAVMAVSGGNTPLKMFKALSQAEIDWTDVIITLVDERWVDIDDARSNARLVSEHLLVGRASFARFVPLYQSGHTAQQAETETGQSIDRLSKPFDVVVLGMGSDGHTASWFSDADNLAEATSAKTIWAVKAMHSKIAGDTRMTLTLPLLISSRFLGLHIEGAAKRNVLAKALAEGDADQLPIRHILQNRSQEMNIFWSP